MTDTPEKTPENEETPPPEAATAAEPSVSSEDKEKKEETVYAGFNQRMLAVGVDVLLVYVLLAPPMQMVTGALYGPLDTSQGMLLLQALAQEIGSGAMTLQEAAQFFFASDYARRWVIENLFQAVVTGLAVVPFWAYYGASPGMWLFSLRIEDADSGGRPGWAQSALRFLMCILSFAPLMLGFVWMMLNKRRQTWHDLAASTVVTRRKWRWERGKKSKV